MTKLQRRKIYEKVLWCIGFAKTGYERGVCDLLRQFSGGSTFLGLGHVFPEFFKVKAEMLGIDHPYAGWSDNESGDDQRRLALEKAIQLTYA